MTDPTPAPRMSGQQSAAPEEDPTGFFKFVGLLCALFTAAIILIAQATHSLNWVAVVGSLPTAVLTGICWRPKWMNGLLMYLADKAPNWITAYKKPAP